MTYQASLPIETHEKFSKLAELLDEASHLMRELSRSRVQEGKLPASNDLWAQCEELQEAFSDLNEKQVDALVNRAIHAVRAEKYALS